MLEIYERADGTYAWRLIANNGQIIATDGGQGYKNEADAFDMAVRIVKGEFAQAARDVLGETE